VARLAKNCGCAEGGERTQGSHDQKKERITSSAGEGKMDEGGEKKQSLVQLKKRYLLHERRAMSQKGKEKGERSNGSIRGQMGKEGNQTLYHYPVILIASGAVSSKQEPSVIHLDKEITRGRKRQEKKRYSSGSKIFRL